MFLNSFLFYLYLTLAIKRSVLMATWMWALKWSLIFLCCIYTESKIRWMWNTATFSDVYFLLSHTHPNWSAYIWQFECEHWNEAYFLALFIHHVMHHFSHLSRTPASISGTQLRFAVFDFCIASLSCLFSCLRATRILAQSFRDDFDMSDAAELLAIL